VSPLKPECIKGIKAILSWHTEVMQIKKLSVNNSVNYGRTWKASRDIIITIIPVGYAAGYSKLASNKGFALVNGKRALIEGRICMDFMMLDVSTCGVVTINS